MSRETPLALAALIAAAASATPARADAGATLGEPSRTAALAGASTARVDTAAIHVNPGALAHAPRSTLALHAHLGRLDLWWARRGEPARELRRTPSGFGGALLVRLPGPEWLRRVRLGAAAHVGSRYALRITAPNRRDVPSFPLYGDRVARTALTASLGIELPAGLGIGGGYTLTPTLIAPTLVTFDARRGETPDEGVEVSLERQLRIEGSALAGARWRATRWLALGLAWRQRVTAAARGDNDTRAGPVVVDAEIDFYEMFAPQQLAFGVLLRPLPSLSVSADVVWARWSGYRTIHNEDPEPAFDDVVDTRIGVEWKPLDFWTVRAGYGFEPTPVPPQRGTSNFLDSDRHVLGLGLGLDLEPRGWARMRVDLHARWHVLESRRTAKDRDALPDADPDRPGTQIDNLGYPGLRSGGTVAQGGITVTIPLDELPREGTP